MKYLEIIELRTAENIKKLWDSQMQKLIDDVAKETSKDSIKAYCRVMVDTDFSIHLFHDTEKIENSGSELGFCLAESLKEFGLVNHSIWIET